MSTDQLIFQADHPTRQDEWLDFDNLFEFPSGYLDSNPTSVNSISPRDFDMTFTDAELINWDSDPLMSSQALFPDFVNYDASLETYGQPMLPSSQPIIDPCDLLQQAPLPLPQEEFIGSGLDSVWLHDTQTLEDPFYSSIRQVVESQAALDPRCFSQKEKRRDASIALHMQRLQDTPVPNLDMPSDSSNGFSSPYWPDSPPERSRASPATSSFSDTTGKSSPQISGSESGAGAMQLVLDLNMNTTTNVPRKQKPRSKAQKENYIKARKYGVCEKHRKQHKRCNCLEKAAAAHLSVKEASCAPVKGGVGFSNFNPSLHVHTSQRSANPELHVNGPSRRPVKDVLGAGLIDVNPDLHVNVPSRRPTKHITGVGLNPDLHVHAPSRRLVRHVSGAGLSNANPDLHVNVPSRRPAKHMTVVGLNSDLHVNASSRRLVKNASGVGLSNVNPDLRVHVHSRRPVKDVPGAGLNNVNPDLHVSGPSRRPAKHVMGAGVNPDLRVHVPLQHTAKPVVRPQVRPDVRPRPNVSLAQRVHQFVSTAGRNAVSSQAPHLLRPGYPEAADAGSSCRYQTRQTTQNTQAHHTNARLVERRPHRLGHQPLDAQAVVVIRGTSNVRQVQGCRAADQPQSLVKQAGGVLHGLCSFWQGSTTLSSWAGVFFGRLVLFSSGLYMRSRKGMGLF